jgi:hypothetical protein
MQKLCVALVAASLLALSAPANAAQINISSVTGTWTDVDPNVASGVGTPSIRWGTSTGSGQSGYNFISHVPPPVVLGIGATFDLATFQHINQPITGNSITQATLDVYINFTTDLAGFGGPQQAHSQFIFNHNETPNDCAPPGCANDIVTAFLNPLNTTHFLSGGHDYVFGITGFQVGNTAFASFSSPEGSTNSAELNASFNDAGTFAVPGPIVGAGLPGLLVGCFSLLGLAGWRRRKTALA